jgi:drug/metabolite transporter (DMT)-like permease
MDSAFVGEAAALFASVLWTFTSLAFAAASRKIGPISVNMWRMLFALGLLATCHIILLGRIVPEASGTQWLWLGASGIIGLAIGDLGYFGALMIIGPRRGTLLMAINPIFSSILGYYILDEVLTVWAVTGIAVTLTGVSLVILEREQNGAEPAMAPGRKALGVFAGVVGSVGQGVGLVLSKYGMINAAPAGHPLDPLSATLMRMLAAILFFFIAVVLMRKLGEVRGALSNKEGMKATLAGTMIGPFLGVWTFMVAVTYADAGVAATLGSLMPVFIIPVVYVLYREKTSWRGVLGAVVAIAGVAILMLM